MVERRAAVMSTHVCRARRYTTASNRETGGGEAKGNRRRRWTCARGCLSGRSVGDDEKAMCVGTDIGTVFNHHAHAGSVVTSGGEKSIHFAAALCDRAVTVCTTHHHSPSSRHC